MQPRQGDITAWDGGVEGAQGGKRGSGQCESGACHIDAIRPHATPTQQSFQPAARLTVVCQGLSGLPGEKEQPQPNCWRWISTLKLHHVKLAGHVGSKWCVLFNGKLNIFRSIRGVVDWEGLFFFFSLFSRVGVLDSLGFLKEVRGKTEM